MSAPILERESKVKRGRRRLGYIYFIASQSGQVKIGKTEDVDTRFASLQTAHWTRLTLVEALWCDMACEKLLHDHFKAYHIAREWFEYTDEIDVLIEEWDQFRDHFEVGIDNPLEYEDVKFILATLGKPWVSRWPVDRQWTT